MVQNYLQIFYFMPSTGFEWQKYGKFLILHQKDDQGIYLSIYNDTFKLHHVKI